VVAAGSAADPRSHACGKSFSSRSWRPSFANFALQSFAQCVPVAGKKTYNRCSFLPHHESHGTANPIPSSLNLTSPVPGHSVRALHSSGRIRCGERKNISRTWQVVGHASRVASPGDAPRTMLFWPECRMPEDVWVANQAEAIVSGKGPAATLAKENCPSSPESTSWLGD